MLRRKSPTGIQEQKFGVTICSEGAYPALFRRLAAGGSGFVVLLLNDSWFTRETPVPARQSQEKLAGRPARPPSFVQIGGQAAMILHAQIDIMRAVENHLAVVRSANSGWSCVIESDGWVKTLSPRRPMLNKAGFYFFHVFADCERTFYNQYGDIFAVLCLVFVIIHFVIKGIWQFRQRREK